MANTIRVLIRNDPVTVPSAGETALGCDFFDFWRFFLIFFGVKIEIITE
jgi:hypothetical protein